MHQPTVEPLHVYIDASLERVGAKFQNKVYSCIIPQNIKNLCSIVHLEALNMLMALRLWCKWMDNKPVIIWCDNIAVVNVFNSFRVRDPWLMAVTRTMWLYMSGHNIDLQVRHVKGCENVYADVLSRWHMYEAANTTVVQYLKILHWENVSPDWLLPDFDI